MMENTNEMTIIFDSRPVNEALARVAVASFCTQLNPTLEEISDLKTAVSEAVTNCIIHGYEGEIHKIRVECRLRGQELQVIEDMGDWIKVDIDGEDGYVASEYVNVKSELDTALTLSEALYGEGVTDVRISICDFAKQYVGNRYVWGGTSLTKGADCSGFTLAVYRNFGISLPHSSRAQANCGTKISVGDVKPGDLIFYGSGKHINHVAMYIGGGRVVHASNARTGITISNMYYRSPVTAARILKD